MNNIKISIIIPVYNVAGYLPRCIDSIINQTYKNIEIICVNDGSTDKSLNILEEYAKKDNRIKIINQSNRGVSVARNVGLEQSTGEYLIFVDGDDWIDINACEILSKYIEDDLDVIFYGYQRINGHSISHFNFDNIKLEYLKKYNFYDIYNNLLCNIPAKGVWDKLYKKEYLNRNNISFMENITHGEDAIFMMQVAMYNPKIKVLNQELYYYDFTREDAVSRISSAKYLEKLITYKDAISAYNSTTEIQEKIKAFFIDDVLFNLSLIAKDLYKSDRYKHLVKNSLRDVLDSDSKKLTGYRRLKIQNVIIKMHASILFWYIIKPLIKYLVFIPSKMFKSNKKSATVTNELTPKSYEIISLGYDCATRRYLTKSGLKKTKKQGELSMVFDLSYNPVKSIIKILRNNFCDYFNDLTYKNNIWMNKKYKILYNHDKDCGKDDKFKLISRFSQRIHNFNNIIKTSDFIYFVLKLDLKTTKADILTIYRLLSSLRKNKPFILIILDMELKFKGKSFSNKNIKLISIKHPFPKINDWWKENYINSEQSIDFQNKICLEIENEILKRFKVMKYTKQDINNEYGDY